MKKIILCKYCGEIVSQFGAIKERQVCFDCRRERTRKMAILKYKASKML